MVRRVPTVRTELPVSSKEGFKHILDSIRQTVIGNKICGQVASFDSQRLMPN